MTEESRTWWDGVPAQCRRVFVRVEDPAPGRPKRLWYLDLIGSERWAIEVTVPDGVSGKAPGLPGDRVYIDDDHGWGWRKVTMLRGHRGVVSGVFHRVTVLAVAD